MSSSKCARCDQTVYPVEGLRCLDKIWHKGCFKCHECNMTLSLKNYKGYDKRPYCNAHCPQAKATTVADTPEIRRLAENTRIQSQAKYHEDFEKSKRKGFTAIADDPETIRITNTSKIISNAAYHGEIERKKQMEEKRGLSGSEKVNSNNNNNTNYTNNNGKPRVQPTLMSQVQEVDYSQNQMNSNHQSNQSHHQPSNIQQIHIQQQQQFQKQQQHLKQQELLKQQQQHHHHHQQQQQQQQQIMYAQDHNGHIASRGHGQQLEGPIQRLPQTNQVLQHYAVANPQQQMLMRQHQMMMQQQRQAMDQNGLLPRQNSGPQQPMMKHQMIPASQHPQNHLKYVPINEVTGHLSPPTHLIGGAQMMNQTQTGGLANGQRIPSNASITGPHQVPHHMVLGHYTQHPIGPLNGPMPKQQHFIPSQAPRHLMQSSHIQSSINHQIRPQQMQHHHPQMQYSQQPLQTRVFRAMYDYEANDVDEVTFFENDYLIDCVDAGGNWLIGKVARTGQEGMFPANYVTAYSNQ